MTHASSRLNLYREVWAVNESCGTFYAVGVGPGDPELLTRQACRILQSCPVIAAPRTKSGQMLALDIARGAVALDGKTILPLAFTMSQDKTVRAEGYSAAADCIAEKLNAGLDVAMVSLGDVSIYATAYYVLEVLRVRGYRTVMTPGVTSFSAVASRLGCSLTEMEQPLHILPGSAGLDEALALPGTKVLMKSGSAIHETVAALARHGMLECAELVCDCCLPTEQVYRDLRALPEQLSYFATIVVHERSTTCR